MKRHIGAVFALGLLIAIAVGCSGSFTTANISELKFGKNDKADPATTTFNTGEDIYAVATVSNANSSTKYKLNWKVTYEDVKGKSKGEEVGTKSMDFEGSTRLWQTFSTGLPGEYKVEATLVDDTGKTIEAKSGMVSVKGSAPAGPAKDEKKSDDDS